MYYNSVMSNITTMNGGLLLNDTYESKSIEDAIDFFKSNSTFSILTNSSLSCITFKAVLKPPVESPFIHIRSGIIEQPVTTLLFKYFPINTLNAKNKYTNFYTHQSRGTWKYIELANISDIENEYNIQLKIYQTTYNTISSAYEPVCPYPIHYFTDLDKNTTIQEIKDRLDNTKEDTENKRIITDTLGGAINSFIEVGTEDGAVISYTTKDDAEAQVDGSNARDLITTLGCIVMEFMDEYITLEKYSHSLSTSDHDYKKAKSLAAYELVRLREIGFIHGDLHHGNIMYNPNYKYITNKDDEYTGRALLIDFGQSLINKQVLEKEENAFYLDKTHKKLEDVYERKGRERWLKFYPPYTFEMIYEKRLNVTLAFRETMINGLTQMFSDYNALPEEEKTKFVQDKKIQLKLDLITNSKWPTNFVAPNVNDFKKEEFDTPFKEVRDTIFETSNEKIQRFTQKLKDIRPKVQALIELKEAEPPPAEPPAEPPAAEPPAAEPPAAEPPAAELETPKPSPETLNPLLESNAKALTLLEHLTKKFTILFPTTPSAHGGRRYIHSHKKHKKHKKHKNQTDFTNRLKHRIRTTLRIKRRQTKRGKRGKRSKRKQ